MQWLRRLGGGRYFQDITEVGALYRRRIEDPRTEEGCTVIMLADPDQIEPAMDDGMTELLTYVIDFPSERLSDELMPLGERVIELRQIFDEALPKAFDRAKTRVRLVGNQTGAGSRAYFFMVEDRKAAERALDRTPLPKGLSRRTGDAYDPVEFARWLKPDWFELEEAKDDEVRSHLAKDGDTGFGLRGTRFYFYGGDLRELAREAEALGFEAEPTTRGEGVIISKDMEVTEAAMAPLHQLFFDWVERLGVEYDGWETQVRRPLTQ